MPGIHARPRVAGAGPEVWQGPGNSLTDVWPTAARSQMLDS